VETASRRLMWHGIFLFLLGLFTGFAESHVANVRMGLAAHLEGVMNGIFLVAVCAMWPHVKLAANAKATAFWLTLYGTYLNWLITLLAAIFGAGCTPRQPGGALTSRNQRRRLITWNSKLANWSESRSTLTWN
jgi:hydroxylaminobenzene mutase